MPTLFGFQHPRVKFYNVVYENLDFYFVAKINFIFKLLCIFFNIFQEDPLQIIDNNLFDTN